MEIIEIPQEQALLCLTSTEILVLWRALARAREGMSREQFIDNFDTSPKHSLDMERKLSEARMWPATTGLT